MVRRKATEEKPELISKNNNTPDYINNLVFLELTWQNFIDFLDYHEIKYIESKDAFGKYVNIKDLLFYESGKIKLKDKVSSLAQKRTIQQMRDIVASLFL